MWSFSRKSVCIRDTPRSLRGHAPSPWPHIPMHDTEKATWRSRRMSYCSKQTSNLTTSIIQHSIVGGYQWRTGQVIWRIPSRISSLALRNRNTSLLPRHECVDSCRQLRCKFNVHGSVDHKNIICPTRCNVTQFILSGKCSTYFGWYHHPSSGAQTTISIAAGTSNGLTNTRCCRYSCLRSWWWVVV